MSNVVRDGEYLRDSSPEQRELEAKLFDLYGLGEDCWVWTTCSGSNSLALVIEAVLRQRRHVGLVLLYAEELFDGSAMFFENIRDVLGGVLPIAFKPDDGVELRNRLRGLGKNNIAAVFFESCSNPSGRVPDPAIFDLLAPETIVIMDNTWLSPVSRPFQKFPRVDIVIESCAKYISGNQVIMGLLALRPTSDRAKELEEHIDMRRSLMGIHTPPASCKLVCDALDSLPQRMATALSRTRACVAALAQDEATVQWSGDSCVFRLLIPRERSLDAIEATIRRSGLACETSYGKSYDSVELTLWNNQVSLRVAVGYQDEGEPLARKLLDLLSYLRSRD